MNHKINELVGGSAVSSSVSMISKAVARAFEDNRGYLLSQLRKIQTVDNTMAETELKVSADWIAIDSMSKLRGIVGGRFGALKAKWQFAGLPLKEKKGEQLPQFTVNPEGWVELETWLLKSGFSARLKPGDLKVLFEIKKSL
jgi:hypothetical protein